MCREWDYVNFGEDYELNYILKKYNKQQTEANRELLRGYGNECKEKLGKKMITHKEFYKFLEEDKKWRKR